VEIWHYVRRYLGTFSLCMRRNGCFGASGQKSDTAILSCDLDLFVHTRTVVRPC